MRLLVIGGAGFIGFYVTERLLTRGDEIIGLDNLNDNYNVRTKYGRLQEVGIIRQVIEYPRPVKSHSHAYGFVKLDLKDRDSIESLFSRDEVQHGVPFG